jgi:hypothetical protein
VSYPVTFEADYVEQRNRLTTFFRLILAIPVAIVLWFYEIVAFFAVIFAWFAIVITGRYPDGLYQFVAGVVRFLTRVTAYTALLCDPYPPFGGVPDASYPIRMEFAGPLPQYMIGILLEIGAIAAWFVILIVGRLPRGLFDVMVLANSYAARSDAYLFLLTETYPPFQDEQTRAAGLAEY